MLYLDLGVVLTTAGNIFLYIVYRIFLEAKKDVAVSTEQAMYIVFVWYYIFFNCMWKNVPG